MLSGAVVPSTAPAPMLTMDNEHPSTELAASFSLRSNCRQAWVREPVDAKLLTSGLFGR